MSINRSNLRLLEKSHLERSDPVTSQKGKDAENAFRFMTNDLREKGFLPWITNLNRANRVEDLLRGFDFRITALGETENGKYRLRIKIQVKSSRRGAEIFLERHPRSSIHVVIINKFTTPQSLRQVLDGIYLKEIETHSQPTPATV